MIIKIRKPIIRNISIVNQLHSKNYYIKIFTSRYMGRTKENTEMAKKEDMNLQKNNLKIGILNMTN